jgi:acyl-CoA thioesterase
MDVEAQQAPGDLQASLGIERIVRMEAGRAVIEYRCGLHMCHSGGVAQGGFVAGWIDAAMAHAVIGEHGSGVVPMTLEMKTSYFAPATPGIVTAEGWIERGGGRTIFTEGRLLDSEGRVLAKASSTIRLVDGGRVAAKIAAN